MYQYLLQEQIGGGGFADVWRAIRSDTRAEVAIKLLRDYRNADARHRFEREVRLLQALRHRRIITLIEANLTAERPFYVMPLMKGGALTAWAGRLPHENVRVILRELADALAHLHEKGGFHRDIKPDNVLVDSAGQFAVGDFGLGNNPKYTFMFTQHAVGTWGYMAPELLEAGAKATALADIFSLGATIFHLLTGMHPANVASLDPWSVRRDIPADLRNLVVQMVQRDPRSRPNARRLIEALVAYRAAQPRPAPPPPPKSKGAAVGLGVAGGLLLLLAGIGVAAALSDD
jgi:serine/threonine protein kinase